MPTSEEMKELVVSVAKGDQQAFVILFNHFAPRIVTYLRRGGTPPSVAEEISQEAMVMAWRKAGTFDPSLGAVATWLFTIARNLRVDRYRREGGEHRGFDQEIDSDSYAFADPEPSPEQRLAVRQREGRVRAALRQLSPQQVHLLQRSFFADSTHDDISRDLCVPLGTVKSQIRRALISMRRYLEATES